MNRLPTDPDSIRRLGLIMAETGMTELELADKDCRIRVVRGFATAAPVATIVSAAPAAQAIAAVAAAPAAPAEEKGEFIDSPMVGVVYLAPEPGKPPFVHAGDRVVVGQTVCTIEAMKTFNPIKSPYNGTIVKVLVENSSPVEFGEHLMLVAVD